MAAARCSCPAWECCPCCACVSLGCQRRCRAGCLWVSLCCSTAHRGLGYGEVPKHTPCFGTVPRSWATGFSSMFFTERLLALSGGVSPWTVLCRVSFRFLELGTAPKAPARLGPLGVLGALPVAMASPLPARPPLLLRS